MKRRRLLVFSALWLIVALISFSGVTGLAATEPAVPGVAEIPLTLADPVDAEMSVSEADRQPFAGLPFDWQAWAVVLVAVVALFGLRFFSRRKETSVPADVFELLGEANLGNGQPVRIVRFGPKTLLIASGSGGPKTLSELDDPLATEWIAAACRGEQTLRVAKGKVPGENTAGKKPVVHGSSEVRETNRSHVLLQPEVA